MISSFLLQIETVDQNSTGVKDVPLWEIIGASSQGFGLIINIILALMLGYVIFIFVERFLALRKATKEDQGFINRIKDYIINNKIDSAKDYCSSSKSPSARMIEKGLQRVGKPMKDITTSIENIGKLEISKLERRLSMLATISGVAPMLGFLGTVLGMVKVFQNMSKEKTFEIASLSGGIMEAMITTVGGLIVGIVAYVAYNYLVSKVDKVIHNMEGASIEFIDILEAPGK